MGGYGLAALAVLCFSTSSLFVRLAAPLSPYEITCLRLLIAAATAGLALLFTSRKSAYEIPHARRFVWYGLIAALHFLLFVAALSLTSIAHALSITYTAPAFIALGSWWLLGERLELRQAAGVLLAVIGIAVLAGFQPHVTRRALLGDALALLSAICFAIYSIAGRSERSRVGLLPYAVAVYGFATAWLLPAFAIGFSGLGREPGAGVGFSPYHWKTMAAVLGSGFLPLGVGHTLYNASLRRMPATYANLIASQEVTGGVLLGVLVLGEIPTLNSIAGGAVALLGIALVLV